MLDFDADIAATEAADEAEKEEARKKKKKGDEVLESIVINDSDDQSGWELI